MFCHLADLPFTRPAVDVLVVGSGPAGLTLAAVLRSRGAQVVVLESGGLRAAADELNRTIHSGLHFPGDMAGRARGFGGTGELWSGQCLPLDDIDFVTRDWVPGSGWPISVEELEPWLRRAGMRLHLQRADYREVNVDKLPVALPAFDPKILQWRAVHYSPTHRLGSRVKQGLRTDPDIQVVLDATVVQILAKNGLTSGVIARSRGGVQRRLFASVVVLACGGLENARLLLDSDIEGHGIGTSSGFVGQGFQDHPYWLVGEVVDGTPLAAQIFQSIRVDGVRVRPKVRLSDDEQRLRRLLNCVVDIEVDHGPRSAVGSMKRLYSAVQDQIRPNLGLARDALSAVSNPGTIAREFWHRRRGVAAPPDPNTRLLLRVQTEQPPLGPSRVALSDTFDSLGRRRLDVHWTVGEPEHSTCIAMAEIMKEQFAAADLGRIRIFPWLQDFPRFQMEAHDYCHHAGTTRMSHDPSRGVVDENCKVHELDNLYVVGSSVFPSSGYANPTLTIVALAERLGHYLALS